MKMILLHSSRPVCLLGMVLATALLGSRHLGPDTGGSQKLGEFDRRGCHLFFEKFRDSEEEEG